MHMEQTLEDLIEMQILKNYMDEAKHIVNTFFCKKTFYCI